MVYQVWFVSVFGTFKSSKVASQNFSGWGSGGVGLIVILGLCQLNCNCTCLLELSLAILSPDHECKIRPFSDLFSSKSQILIKKKNLRNSDYLGLLGRDLDPSGISQLLQTNFKLYPILQ